MNDKNDHEPHDRGFMKGVNPSAFLDVYTEWHALVEGFCEVMCPWPPPHPLQGELLDDLKGEHHYYMFGRALAVLVWIAICCGIAATFT